MAIIGFFLMTPALQVSEITAGAQEQAETEILPGSGPPVWLDHLDDMSRLYVPPGGLVGVEVAGGAAQLQPGSDSGWFASEVLHARDGHRYDLVLIEAETPGGSYIEISMLNASAEPSEVGFANETIDGLKLIREDELSVYSLSPLLFPKLRIQLNLVADGAHRPRVLKWALHYISNHEWRDDFLSMGKLSDHSGINLTDERIEINLTKKGIGSHVGSYEAYPPIFGASSNSGVYLYAPNTGRTGYMDGTAIGSTGGSVGVATADIDGDGLMDLVTATETTSYLMWGSESGTWSTTSAVSWSPTEPQRTAVGDFDGDGNTDVVFACNDYYSDPPSPVFLSDGGRTFSTTADTEFGEYSRVAVGDLNSDGYDDIAFSNKQANCDVFYGGPSGPDSYLDRTYNGNRVQEIVIEDMDGDGFVDLVLGDGQQGKVHIFLGGMNGPDTTADHVVTFTWSYCYGLGVGDLNGDGFKDIVFNSYNYPKYQILVCPGSSTGWSSNDVTLAISERMMYSLEVGDVDLDGYDDIIYAMYDADVYEYYMRIAKGGTSIPTTHSISVDGEWSWDLAVAIPRGPGSTRTYRGSFETRPITLPQGSRWDVLHLEGSVPQNTTVSVTLLDSLGKPIPGFQDLPSMDVDLQGLRFHSVVRVLVTLTSEFNWTTPVLDSLLLNWMGEDEWRDEFYGGSKISRLFSMELEGGALVARTSSDTEAQLLFASLRASTGYSSESTVHVANDGLDFANGTTIALPTRGVSAVDSADVNGDGWLDLAFATFQTSDSSYMAKSPLFLGSPVGWMRSPYAEFPSVGASDVLLEDLDGDGHVDVVLAQERSSDGYDVGSVLFWGSAEGWSSVPDVTFSTRGASGVTAMDMDGDGLLDLAFSCYKDVSTSADSMVFYQEASGFCGTVPGQLLPTKGARAVAAGDVDGDGIADLVFANSFSGGFAEIDSFVYWGAGDGAFEAVPAGLPTKGASDVAIADLDGDGNMDVVFANKMDDTKNHRVDSAVYLGTGTRSLPTTPSALLPTMGASAVAVADIDGAGWKDLAFACIGNGSAYEATSRVYMGGTMGWSMDASVQVPTVGASDVLAAPLLKQGSAGYLSQSITVDPVKVGDFDTLTYHADIGPSVSGWIRLVDAETLEVLAEAQLADGGNDLSVAGSFKVKTHPSVRVMVAVEGLGPASTLELFRVTLNWTERVRRAPIILDMEMGSNQVYRLKHARLNITTNDEFDPGEDLRVEVQHRLKFTDVWSDYLVSGAAFDDGAWCVDLFPKANDHPGTYVFRINVTDSDGDYTGWVEFPDELAVLNNPPSTPEIRLDPVRPVTTSTLSVEIVGHASDLESSLLQYHYQWYMDGEPVENATEATLPFSLTTRGQNWSVEVSAFDGDDEGPPVTAWRLISNAAPFPREQLPDPELDEDTTDEEWLNLLTAFEDPDGDTLEFRLESNPAHLTVLIDQSTGVVTLEPERDWNGEEEITFVASDGEFQASQTVLVRVVPVNDPPEIVGINGFVITSDPVEYTILQGELLTLQMDVIDVEGHELVFIVNTSAVQLDEATGLIRFEPDNDAVGALRFGLKVYDLESPSVKVTLNFIIHVENENDPMDNPRITYPADGETFKANKTFYLTAICSDPDTQWGQVLNFTWTSSLEGLMGHENTLTTSLGVVGTHIIQLTVKDGKYEKSTYIELHIEPGETIDPNPDPDPVGGGEGDDGVAKSVLILAALGALIGVGVGGYAFAVKRREDRKDAIVDAEEVPDDMDESEALRRMAETARESADKLEESKNGVEDDVWVEAEVKEGIEIATSSSPSTNLSIEARVTEEASRDTQALWSDIDDNGHSDGATEQDKEALRLENLKRKYQNAIGRLPYGIPSKELRDWDWVDLANALAIGESKTVEDGKPVTRIGDRWYYSDHEDSSTFLKEHGVKPRPERRATTTTDKATLLEKLEERLILGEISEETYTELKRKYGG